MKILIVEDNFELANIYRQVLKNNLMIADIAPSIKDLYSRDLSTYEMVLLDINLPDGSGIDALKVIRQKNLSLPVIIVSARHESEIVVEGLNIGADDYLRKPVDFDEMIARINMVIRRKNIDVPEIFNLGGLQIDYKTKFVKYNEAEINLTQKQYIILQKLAQSVPGYVSSEELFNSMYDEYTDENSSSMRVHIYNLKKKLSIHFDYDVIVSEKAKGYRLCIKA